MPPIPRFGPRCFGTVGRHELAMAAGAARSRHRGPRTGRGVPRDQRRPVLDDTLAACSTSIPSWPLCASCRSACPGSTTSRRMRPHTPAEARGRTRRCARLAGRVPLGARSAPGVRGRRVLPAGRPYRFPPADAYEGFPMHEDGIGMARTFEREFTGRGAVGNRHPPRVLRVGRRCARRRLPGATHRGLADAHPRLPAGRRAAPASSPGSTGPRCCNRWLTRWTVTTCGSSRCESFLRWHDGGHRTVGRRRHCSRAGIGAGGRSLPACPMCVSRVVSSSTTPRRTICPGPSSWSPLMVPRFALP